MDFCTRTFEALANVAVKMDVFGNATPCNLAEVAGVSEEMSTSTITVEE